MSFTIKTREDFKTDEQYEEWVNKNILHLISFNLAVIADHLSKLVKLKAAEYNEIKIKNELPKFEGLINRK